jgi:hypothetical protein
MNPDLLQIGDRVAWGQAPCHQGVIIELGDSWAIVETIHKTRQKLFFSDLKPPF